MERIQSQPSCYYHPVHLDSQSMRIAPSALRHEDSSDVQGVAECTRRTRKCFINRSLYHCSPSHTGNVGLAGRVTQDPLENGTRQAQRSQSVSLQSLDAVASQVGPRDSIAIVVETLCREQGLALRRERRKLGLPRSQPSCPRNKRRDLD